MALPTTMKSLHQPSIYSPDLILHTVPVPKPVHPDDHLIRVHAFAPTLGELTWAANYPQVAGSREHVPGTDVAGTVVSAPDGSPFEVGDRVFALLDFSRAGAGREYTLVRTGNLARLPGSIEFARGAAVPMGGLTAWQNLFGEGGLRKEGIYGDEGARRENAAKKVMVIGAGGGVGSFGVQLAALCGAEVIGVCSSSKAEMVKSLGARSIIDYTRTSIEEYMAANPSERVDLVFDCVGGESLRQAWGAVKEGGVLLSIVKPPEMARPEGLEKKLSKAMFFVVERDGPMLTEIGKLVGEGKLRVSVDSVFGFGEWEKAFEKAMKGKSAGRVVIKVVEE